MWASRSPAQLCICYRIRAKEPFAESHGGLAPVPLALQQSRDLGQGKHVLVIFEAGSARLAPARRCCSTPAGAAVGIPPSVDLPKRGYHERNTERLGKALSRQFVLPCLRQRQHQIAAAEGGAGDPHQRPVLSFGVDFCQSLTCRIQIACWRRTPSCSDFM